jgi:hypothetical protein
MHKDNQTPLEPLTLEHHRKVAAQQPRRRGRIVESVAPMNVAQSRTGPEGVCVDVTQTFASVFAMENDAVFSARAAAKAFAHVKVRKQ